MPPHSRRCLPTAPRGDPSGSARRVRPGPAFLRWGGRGALVAGRVGRRRGGEHGLRLPSNAIRANVDRNKLGLIYL